MADALPTYSPTDALSLSWLIKNNYRLRVIEEGKNYRIMWVADFIRRQDNRDKRGMIMLLNALFLGSVERKLYRWYEKKWSWSDMYSRGYKAFTKRLPKSADVKFRIEVVSSDGEDKGFTEISYNELQTLTPGVEPEDKPEPIIKVEDAITTRQTFIKEETRRYLHFGTEEEKEKVLIEICRELSSGIYTIMEACSRNNMPYMQFVELVTTDEYARRVYSEATQIAQTMASARQLTLVDQRLIDMLVNNKVTSERITYRSIIRMDTLEQDWVEYSKVVNTRSLNPNEVLMIKVALLRNWQLGTSMDTDEFAKMTTEELLDYVKTNYGELDLKRDKRDKRNEGNLLNNSE